MVTEKKSELKKIAEDFQYNKWKYFLMLPLIVYLILFEYKPMYGLVVAFKRFRVALGVDASPWVGLQQFERFLTDPYFWKTLLPNTVRINLLDLVFSFPVPILLAIMLNEVRIPWFKKTVQTLTYLPHFISMVVVCGLIEAYCLSNGMVNDIIAFFGGERTNLLADSGSYLAIYTISDVWKSAGWGSIVFLSALSSLDTELYDAARVDGAGRIKRMRHVVLPTLYPMICMKIIMRVGKLFKSSGGKTILLYQPLTYDVADVIGSYTYRMGMINADYSYGAAVGLFNTVINMILVYAANKVCKKLGQVGIFG